MRFSPIEVIIKMFMSNKFSSQGDFFYTNQFFKAQLNNNKKLTIN